uniref:terminase TerL endonuclease subunit n=1 Tax=Anaerofustis stercorihominis TaxID=214853 RepID=UPI002671B773
ADTGRDRFKTGVLLIGRKNTKSETCSALGLTEAVVGDSGSDIVCASNDDNQSSILYDAIDTMRLLMDPNETSTHKNQSFIKVLHNGSKIFKLSERTRRKEGRNIDKAYVDEVHEMQDNSLVKPLEQSQSLKVNPKLMIISTEGFVYDGYLDNLLIDCRKVINKEDTGISAERMLPWLYTQDSQQEIFQDERSWMKSNPTLGIVKPYEYLREQVDKAKKNKQDRAYVLSKDFNFKMSNTEAWLLPEEYENISTFDLERFRNSICLGAADLAETTDLTCAKILLMLKNDPVKYIYTMYFIPESKLLVENDSGANYKEWARQGLIQISKGNDTDLTEVADWFYKLRKDYNIRLFHGGYDQKFSKEFIKRANAYGMDWEIVNQKKETLTNPMRLVEADLKSKLINYNNNPVDKWCFANTCMDIDKTGTWIKPAKIANQPTRKIDGTAALINLYEIYRRYRSEFMIGVNARKEVS